MVISACQHPAKALTQEVAAFKEITPESREGGIQGE